MRDVIREAPDSKSGFANKIRMGHSVHHFVNARILKTSFPATPPKIIKLPPLKVCEIMFFIMTPCSHISLEVNLHLVSAPIMLLSLLLVISLAAEPIQSCNFSFIDRFPWLPFTRSMDLGVSSGHIAVELYYQNSHFQKMKVTELKQALKAIDLKTTGNKLALVKRLKTTLLKYAGAVQLNKSEGGSRTFLDHGFEFSDGEWKDLLKVSTR